MLTGSSAAHCGHDPRVGLTDGCSLASSLFFSDPGSTFRTVFKLLKTGGLEWWTRTQRLRTLAELPFEAEFRAVVRVPVYQRIAAEGARMQDRGVTVAAIGRHFGVDDHTVDKAIRWFRRR